MVTSVIELAKEFGKLEFYADRMPNSTAEDLARAFAKLDDYRDGGIFIGHYAGNSEWERHPNGDEVVCVVEGETTLVFLQEEEIAHKLSSGMLIVVPKGIWHRFETPVGVKILSITPQPTELSVNKPV